jgi:hypothetical protein
MKLAAITTLALAVRAFSVNGHLAVANVAQDVLS